MLRRTSSHLRERSGPAAKSPNGFSLRPKPLPRCSASISALPHPLLNDGLIFPVITCPQMRALSGPMRSEEHTSELQSLMRISYAVFCLKKTYQPHYSSISILMLSVHITH